MTDEELDRHLDAIFHAPARLAKTMLYVILLFAAVAIVIFGLDGQS